MSPDSIRSQGAGGSRPGKEGTGPVSPVLG